MDLDDIKKQITIIDESTAMKLRQKYIFYFVDIHREYYRKYIEKTKKYIDGYCYDGYLWDTFYDSEIVDEDYFFNIIKNYDSVLACWDIHSSEKIWIPNYWIFKKDAIISLSSKIVLQSLKYLPEDVYFFDRTFEWTIALTHEELNGQRLCIVARGQNHTESKS